MYILKDPVFLKSLYISCTHFVACVVVVSFIAQHSAEFRAHIYLSVRLSSAVFYESHI